MRFLHQGYKPHHPRCTDWRQGAGVFGGIVNGSRFALTQIDLRQDWASVADVEDLLVVSMAQCDALSDEGARTGMGTAPGS